MKEDFSQSGDRINEGFILTNHINSLMQKAANLESGFIFGVDVLEDFLSPLDGDYHKAMKAAEEKLCEAEKNAKGESQIAEINWKRAKIKFRFLMESMNRSGKRKEQRIKGAEEGY